MPRILLFFSLVFVIALFNSGCGGGGGSTSATTQSLDFTTSGTYDLSLYIVPTQNQLSTFNERTYEDSGGNKIYGTIPTKTAQKTQRYQITNNVVEEYDGNGQLDTTYTISQTAITQTSENTGSYETAKGVRYADLGDPVAVIALPVPLEAFNKELPLTMNCRLQKHFDSKTINTVTYDDVITVSCEGVSNSDLTYQNVPVTLDISTTVTFYYAHSLGEIGSVSELCYTVGTSAAQTVQACTKEISEVTSIL